MTSESRNTLIAIAACIGFYFLYTQYLSHRYPDYNKPRDPVVETQGANPAANPGEVSPANPAVMNAAPVATSNVKTLSESELTYENDDLKIRFDQNTRGLASVKLKKYKNELKDTTPEMELLTNGPLVVQGTADVKNFIPQLGLVAGERQGDVLSFQQTSGSWNIKQTYEMPKSGYVMKMRMDVSNQSDQGQALSAGVLMYEMVKTDASSSSFLLPGTPVVKPRFVATYGTDDEFIETEKFCNGEDSKSLSGKDTKFDFIGFDSHYFLMALVPKSNFHYEARKALAGEKTNCPISIMLYQDLGVVAAKATQSFAFDVYMGPKDLQVITDYDEKLKTTLGLGWLDMIARPLLLAIKGIYKVTKNYGVAIIILTLLIKILFFPLARQSAISMAKMKKLNPQMTAIRTKFKDDPQRMQKELMGFMAQNKVNPMQGCLPILPQIPVFFALYRVLSASIELRHAPFFGWIKDLSVQDPYYITPLILGGCMFIQQRLTPMTGVDKTQERVLMFMPILFTLMMLSLPSGLVLYMLTNTIVSIAQQQWLNKRIEATS